MPSSDIPRCAMYNHVKAFACKYTHLETTSDRSRHLAENRSNEPGSEDWRRNVPAAETTAPSLSETVSVQSRPESPPIRRGTSPGDVKTRQL